WLAYPTPTQQASAVPPGPLRPDDASGYPRHHHRRRRRRSLCAPATPRPQRPGLQPLAPTSEKLSPGRGRRDGPTHLGEGRGAAGTLRPRRPRSRPASLLSPLHPPGPATRSAEQPPPSPARAPSAGRTRVGRRPQLGGPDAPGRGGAAACLPLPPLRARGASPWAALPAA
uniref:Uncharacterized protein n=1 Tax=Cricetulus griseus TaxID=10029 RepID=A0A8C2LC55_CRIGR